MCVRVFQSDISCEFIGENFVLSQQAHGESTLSESVSSLLDTQNGMILPFCNVWKTDIVFETDSYCF